MKKLLLIFAFLFSSTFLFGQEYDDMYFNKRDRRQQKVVYNKHINPEYVARYRTEPKVRVQVRSYHYNPYHSSNWNITFGYSNWNYYDPFWYDSFYQPYYPLYGYNSYYYPYYRGWSSFYYPPYYQPYYSWSWHYPHYNHYGWNSYYGYHNYYTKTYVTKHYNEVNYQKRRTDRSSIHVPQKTRTSRSTNNNVISKYSRTQNERNIRTNTNSSNRISRNSYVSPSKQRTNTYSYPSRQKTNTYQQRNTNTYKRSSTNTYQRQSYTKSRSNTYSKPAPSRSYTPSRSSTPSRSYSTPSRSSGRSSSSSGSRSSGRRQ